MLPGGSVIRDCFRLCLSLFVILLSLPLIAISLLVAGLFATGAAILPSFYRNQRDGAINMHGLRTVDEFGFEGALQAYEDLIKTHAWRKP